MKNKMLIAMILSLFSLSLFAQTPKDQMMLVSFVKVQPADSDDYVKAAENFVAMMKDSAVTDVLWYGNMMDDYTYAYAVPITSMAQLDKPYWAEAVKKIGKEKFESGIAEMEKYVIESRNEIYNFKADLSYVHSSIANEENTYRNWTIFEFKPGTFDQAVEISKAWKALYASKNVVNNYQVYFGMLGQNNGTLVVLEFAKDEAQLAERNAKALEAFGKEAMVLWEKTKALLVKRDLKSGYFLPSLTYIPTSEKAEDVLDVMTKKGENKEEKKE